MSTFNACAAYTKHGNSCRNATKDGLRYCGVHRNMTPEENKRLRLIHAENQKELPQLTYNMLKDGLPELSHRCREFVSNVSNRGRIAPEFVKCILSKPENMPKEHIGYITLLIKELNDLRGQFMGFPPTLRFSYAIMRDGHSVYRQEVAYIDMCAETIYQKPLEEWLAWILEEESKKRIQARTALIHEEMVSVIWHPARMIALLEKGGWELVDDLT